MNLPAISFVTADDLAAAAGGQRRVSIIVPRARAYLAPLLAAALKGRRDVEVIVDPHAVEPRQGQGPRAGKRLKEAVIEIVISVPVRTGTPAEADSAASSADRGHG